jgi:Fur family peroxide stress response transcriptional regulator
MEADERFARFADTCREHGLKVTHQRTEVYRELVMTDEHPDAETIYNRVRERMPSISLDTVYRTLRLFEEKGVISRLGSRVERMRFDGNSRPHHHFVCEGCGLVSDFYNEELNAFPPPPEVKEMGSVESVYVEMRGLCAECRKEAKA